MIISSHLQHVAKYLDELLESPVNGRADVGNILPEINGSNSTLCNTFRSELKLLWWLLVHMPIYIIVMG